MTNTESKFREWAKKEYADAFIWKCPDFKQGAKGMGGIPDYLVIHKGKHIWYEVKSAFGDTISLEGNHFTEAQQIIFPKMIKAKANVLVYAFTRTKGIQIFKYKDLMKKRKIKF